VEIPELIGLGADDVIPEEFETSIEIFARVLGHYGAPRAEVDRLVAQIRASHYQALRGGAHASLGTVAGVPQMAMERIPIPEGSGLVGKSVAESGFRARTGALILSVRRGDVDIATPESDFRFAALDVLTVVGQAEQLRAAGELVRA
jgi:CPA2 family monovalent cation:H+ antiporter-2